MENVEILEKIETVQTTALLRSARIFRRILENTCCHLEFSEIPAVISGLKNLILLLLIIIILWDFEIHTDHQSRQILFFLLIIKRRKTATSWILLADNRRQVKEDEKPDKYLDFARKLKKVCNTTATKIPIVVRVLETGRKNLERELDELEIRGRFETIETAGLLRSAKILRRDVETWGDVMGKGKLHNENTEWIKLIGKENQQTAKQVWADISLKETLREIKKSST